MKPSKLFGLTFVALLSHSAHAENTLASITLDNDLFVQKDDGYTNGIYVALYESGGFDGTRFTDDRPEPSFWVKPMLWSMPERKTGGAVNAYNLGQSMFTPDDITEEVPDPNDVPYSAMLAFTNIYITVDSDVADSVSTTVGVVGPMALGEQSQKAVHSLMGAEQPKGWDYQLHNEPVFQLGRGRVWRSWSSEQDQYDILTTARGSVGTLQSSISSSVMFRYGRDLQTSFPSVLLMTTRTSNPIAVEGEWYVYSELEAEYIFNQIFTDGNTFRDSPSIDYDHDYIGVNFGVSYSWGAGSITFAVNHSDLLKDDKNDQYQNQAQYGTLTLAFDI